jgi:hypothetical protein
MTETPTDILLADEAKRIDDWRNGRHFYLETMNLPHAECKRCREEKPLVFVVTVRRPAGFAIADPPISVPVPEHERVCRDCLTDSEIAGLLLPALHFVTKVLLRDWQDPTFRDRELIRNLGYVHSYLACRSSILMRSEKDQKEFSLRALEGLKGAMLPEVNLDSLHTELEAAIARNMYLAAHPDDIPESVEEARKLSERVHLFFRDGASIEVYALRDSVRKCVELFRRYFMRKMI